MFINILKSYGLGILEITQNDYLKRFESDSNLLFDSEKDLIEYRVELGKIITQKDIDEEFDDTDYNDEYYLEQKELLDSGEVIPLEYSIVFSVFSENTEIDEEFLYDHIKNYYEIIKIYLSNIPYNERDAFDDVDKFKVFLNTINANISNSNLEKIHHYSYRLYKDFKFVRELMDYLGENDFKCLIADLFCPL